MARLYTSSAVQELANKYAEVGGEVFEIEEGVLGWGLTVMMAEGYKTAVVKEVPLSAWSSAHTVRMYNRTPRKYLEAIDRL